MLNRMYQKLSIALFSPLIISNILLSQDEQIRLTLADSLAYVDSTSMIDFETFLIDEDIINDSDGSINPGDQINLSLILFNNPDWGEAVNVNATLSSLNNNVIIENPNIYIGNISPGDVGINIENPFTIAFNSDINIGEIELTANIISNEDGYISYTTSFPIILLIEEMSIVLGDLNADSIINILDVVQLVGIILNNNANAYQEEAGDLNQDNIINVQDIILLINEILEL